MIPKSTRLTMTVGRIARIKTLTSKVSDENNEREAVPKIAVAADAERLCAVAAGRMMKSGGQICRTWSVRLGERAKV